MDKKHYTTPYMKVVSIQTSGMLAVSPGDTIILIWSGDQPGDAGPNEIDDWSTFDSF